MNISHFISIKARHVKRYRQSVGANVSLAFCASPLRLTNECQSIYHCHPKSFFEIFSDIWPTLLIRKKGTHGRDVCRYGRNFSSRVQLDIARVSAANG